LNIHTIFLSRLIRPLVAIVFVIALAISYGQTAQASDPIRVVINGEVQSYTQDPVIFSGRLVVPLRGIFEALDVHVVWEGSKRSITSTKGDKTVKLQVDNPVATVTEAGMTTEITLEQPPVLVNGSTMVPFRFIGDAFGAAVHWDGPQRTASITQAKTFQSVDSQPEATQVVDPTVESPVASPSLVPNSLGDLDLNLVLQCQLVAMCEAYGEWALAAIVEAYDPFFEVYFSNKFAHIEIEAEEEIILLVYDVVGDELVLTFAAFEEQELIAPVNDYSLDTWIWGFFTDILPAEHHQYVTQLIFFTDGHYKTMGYVHQREENWSEWVLAMDVFDAGEIKEFIETLVHEFGHLLTLNGTQVNYNIYQASKCSTYLSDEGCSYYDSYLYQFFDRFWSDKKEIWRDYAIPIDQTYQFYLMYEDHFVSDYAATNLLEDIAESWTHFILRHKPEPQIVADEKILFFYEFPELVELRAYMLYQIYVRLFED